MKIPYGIADFAEIRRGGDFYVDKTPFLACLERSDLRNVVFLRPRRMGKSLLLSMLAHYYDLTRADQFDELFGGLWVHQNPTAEKNAHIVLHLNLGSVRGSAEGNIKEGFVQAIQRSFDSLLPRLMPRFPTLQTFATRWQGTSDPMKLLNGIIGAVGSIGQHLYVLIDEYDTFANSLIAEGNKHVYESLTEHTGFIRQFYATLKAGSETGGIARIFITGVSPVLLDDLYTGFNISTNITIDPQFHGLAGFTRADVERALEELLTERPELTRDVRIGNRVALFDSLERHYDGYRFSDDANERVFNSDMVLYFLAQLQKTGKYPKQMLDPNARTDYKKFYGLFHATGQLAEERREVLTQVLTQGGVEGMLLETFGSTPAPPPREQFISLLFYTGMLTRSAGRSSGWLTKFEIPNLVIRNLQWEHFSALLKDTAGIDMVIPALALAQKEMAVRGDIAPFLRALHENVLQAIGLKDLMRFNEKAIKMILITCAVMSGMLHVLSEKEFAQGYCDLFMCPRYDMYEGQYSWLVELKYVKTNASDNEIETAFADAETQLATYSSDPVLVPLLTKGFALKSVAIVFIGTKQIRCRTWPKGSAEEIRVGSPRAKRTAKKPSAKKVIPAKKKATRKV